MWRLALPSRTLPPFDTTNGYLLAGPDGAWLVDPGFEGEAGMATLETALADTGLGPLAAVLLTHHHRDHRAGLPSLLAARPELPVLAHPRALAALVAEVAVPAARALAEGDTLPLARGTLMALATPGHTPDSLSFVLAPPNVALVGDLLAGGTSSWIGRPEGSVADALASLSRLADLQVVRIGPGHGRAIVDPAAALAAAIEHRLDRERQVAAALANRPLALAELRAAIYPNLDPALHDHAERSLLAHLDKLAAEGRAEETSDGGGSWRRRG